MTLAHQIIRRSLLLALFVVIPLADPKLSVATDLPLTGGPGGSPDRAECPRGSYLVGLAGRTGEWVERIAPVCAPWLRGSQTFGAPTVGKFLGTGGGGQEVQSELIAGMPGKVCRGINTNNLIAVQVWHIDTLRSQNRLVQYIEVGCRSLTTPPDTGFLTFGPRSADAEERVAALGNLSPCPVGEGIVGIHGRFGRFVDALGLICGPLPASLGAPTTKLPSPLVQAPLPAVPMTPITKNMVVPPDQFIITKPSGTKVENVPHGQLLIMAIAPRVGATNVAELELRCLNAPPSQQDSYPYTTHIAVDTSKLLQGYPVEQIVTGFCNGPWQVRARSSMKAPPGPWSASVRVNMVKAQAPPPMVQTPKLNAPITQIPAPGSSVMQAPAPNTGTTPMMVRPPATSSGSAASSLMIRPRGVEEPEKKDTGEKKP